MINLVSFSKYCLDIKDEYPTLSFTPFGDIALSIKLNGDEDETIEVSISGNICNCAFISEMLHKYDVIQILLDEETTEEELLRRILDLSIDLYETVEKKIEGVLNNLYHAVM